jgi:AraC-like DNA-binding protein
MYIGQIWQAPPSERLDGGIAVILLKILREAGQAVERDSLTARACLDRASALLESERSRVEFSSVETSLRAGRQLLAPWQVKRVTAYVHQNIGRPIRIYELARLARLTASYFSRAFKATLGMSPKDYISMRRMNLACILMLTTDDPLCQVALACGLSDQAQFTRIFSRIFGCPPGAWRRERRGFIARSCIKEGINS